MTRKVVDMAGDEVGSQGRERAEGMTAREQEPQAAQEPLTNGGDGTGDGAAATGASADYEALLAERDARIEELEGAIAEAARTAEAAEALRAEMDELRRQGDERRVEFELAMAGARNVRAAASFSTSTAGTSTS